MPSMSYLDLIAQLVPAPITWQVVLLVVLMTTLTLGGVTARIMSWFESLSSRSHLQ